jgi:hypothetical protein
VDRFSRRTHFACVFVLVKDSEMGLLDTETNDVDGVSCWSGDESSKICTVVQQNKIGQSVTLDRYRVVKLFWHK